MPGGVAILLLCLGLFSDRRWGRGVIRNDPQASTHNLRQAFEEAISLATADSINRPL